MPNGKPGDHPLTDIMHGRRVYSERADDLVREIVEMGAESRVSRLLTGRFDDFKNPDVAELERVLTDLRDELAREQTS